MNCIKGNHVKDREKYKNERSAKLNYIIKGTILANDSAKLRVKLQILL